MKHRKTVLIIPGFPNKIISRESVLYQYFFDRKYRIIMPDLFEVVSSVHTPGFKNIVDTMLHGTYPDVIVGVSAGGLIAPHIATNYPKAKLIFISTGPYVQTDISIYNRLIRLESKDHYAIGIRCARMVPRGIYRWLYKVIHNHDACLPITEMRRRADENLDGFRSITFKKVQGILRFVVSIDNTEILKDLLNETLIMAGSFDRIMPLGLSREMNALLKRSSLVYADRTHYDVLTEKEYQHIDTFLT